MATFVVGHGILASGRPETIAPIDGSITFITDVDLALLQVNGLLAIEQGNGAGGYYQPGGAIIENYSLQALSEWDKHLYEVVREQSGSTATVMYVGFDGVPDPVNLCDATDDDMCSGGRHKCGGIFGRVDDQHIVYLACRSAADNPDAGAQAGYGAQADSEHFSDIGNEVLELLTQDWVDAGTELARLRDGTAEEQIRFANLMTDPRLNDPLSAYYYLEHVRQGQASDEDVLFVAAWIDILPDDKKDQVLTPLLMMDIAEATARRDGNT